MSEKRDEEASGDVSVIVPAAGEGVRMGGGVRKPFLALAGESILFRTCRRLREASGVFEIIVAAHPGDVDYLRSELWEEASGAGVTLCVAGGASRAETVWNALQVVSARAELVAVHDGVRPFVTVDLFNGLIAVARKRGAAAPVVPLTDTVKRIEGDVVVETVRRAGLMRVQTPQVFRSDLLIEAYEYCIRTGGLSERVTDDAQLVEAMGCEVVGVYGGELNMKITVPSDVRVAEALLAAGLVG